MARGSKKSYSNKQQRQAEHIEDSVKSRGGKTKDAERIAWATVNKKTGGAKKKKAGKKKTSKKTTKKASKKTSKKKSSKKTSRKKTSKK
jgi:ATP-dependent exoDNAse (exonuclease V) alpha subunit